MRKAIQILACLAVLMSAIVAWAETQTEAPVVGEQRREEKKAVRPVTPVEKGGGLLPTFRLVIEPSFEYDHFSGQNVSISGFTIFEAILIGQVSVQKVKRDIFIPALTLRLGLKDSEINVKIPYFIRQDKLIFPRSGGGTTDLVEDTEDDTGLGDIQSYFYYHLINEGKWKPWVPDTIIRVGVNFPTGKDPYNLNREFNIALGNLLATEFPTGTGHWGTSFGVTFVKSVDPAVLFLNVAYYYNFERNVGTVSGIDYGTIKLGNSFEYSVGLIFALQEKLSMNFSLNQRITGQTQQNGVGLADTSLNAIAFNIGATYIVNPRWTVDFVVGLGLSDDAPDVSALIRVPISFQLGR